MTWRPAPHARVELFLVHYESISTMGRELLESIRDGRLTPAPIQHATALVKCANEVTESD